MTTLFDCSQIVKPTSFGRGLLRSLPVERVEYSQADLDWHRADIIRRENQALDQAAGEFAAQHTMDSGLCIL